MSKSFRLIFVFLAVVSCAKSQDKDANFVENNYLKQEFRIPMRDGATLFTAVYSPLDTSVSYPFMIWRTPYSSAPYGNQNYRELHNKLVLEKYIFVVQDVRGKFMSEGEFVNMRPYIKDKSPDEPDETTDTFDTIEWLLVNIPNNNGKVGIWGISYPGFYAAQSLIDSHPALKAVSPQAPIADWFIGDDMHHHGALSLVLNFNFFQGFGRIRDSLHSGWPEKFEYASPDAYTFFLSMGPLKNFNEKILKNRIPFWNETMTNGVYNSFWKSRITLPHFKDIKPASMIVGGLFDSENLYGALNTYRSIEEKNPGGFNVLVLGPWSHGAWYRSDGNKLGDIDFGEKTSEYYLNNYESPFFNSILKENKLPEFPEITIFETGSNFWKYYNSWPPPNVQDEEIFLDENFTLSFNAPSVEADSFDSYISNPAKPVPYTNILRDSRAFYPKEYMTEDQRFAYVRTDVLSYSSEVLEEDITFSGPLTAKLFVSTTGTCSDWVVKLIDVFPFDEPNPVPNPDGLEMGGYQMLVRGEIFRSKFRKSYEFPEAMTPGEVTEINIPMMDVNHTFKKDHRIMLQIQSSWFPYFDRNPQKFLDIYSAGETDFNSAVQKVYRKGFFSSRLLFGRLKS